MATAKKKSAKKSELNFEDALERLSEINERLESGEVTLDEGIELYTEGMELAKFCQEKLSDAEKRIKVLVEKGGALIEEDFDESD
jgi:exodeoxyribonuclease VII small subunit